MFFPMKQFFALFLMVALVVTIASAQTKVGGPVMKFDKDKTEIDYGTIQQNSDPLRKFTFTNAGTEPLVIKSAQGSCGCTVPSYKKEPIMPGEASVIEVRYATDRIGAFTKTVTLTTNEGDQPRVLTIKGNVLEKKTEPGTPLAQPGLASPKG